MNHVLLPMSIAAIGFGGAMLGHLAYDAAKLYRRKRRRARKIAAETADITYNYWIQS